MNQFAVYMRFLKWYVFEGLGIIYVLTPWAILFSVNIKVKAFTIRNKSQ